MQTYRHRTGSTSVTTPVRNSNLVNELAERRNVPGADERGPLRRRQEQSRCGQRKVSFWWEITDIEVRLSPFLASNRFGQSFALSLTVDAIG